MNYKFSVPQGWNESQLQDYCLKVADGTHDSPKKTERGKLLVTSKNIIGGTLDLSKSYRISEEDFNDVNRRSKVDKNDVLLSMIGTVGEVCLIESEPDFAIKNVGLLKNQDPLKAKWLFFYLTSPQAQAQIKERLRGTTQQYLPLGEIRKFPIIYPKSRTEMQEIVGVLAALQDKIQLNHQINQTLEQMAQAIFKSWFVDFEPVKAKIATLEAGGSEEDALLAAMQAISGKDEAELNRLQAEQPEQYADLRTTAELFPSAMQGSEMGEIPAGWETKRVGNYLDSISKTFPLKSVNEIIFLNTGDIKDGRFLHSEKSLPATLPGQAKKSIKKDDILYSEIRPKNKRYAYVHFESDDYVVSTKLMVLRSTGEIDPKILYFILTQEKTIDHLQMMAESRSGTFPQITFTTLEHVDFVGPSDNQLLNIFSKKFLSTFMSKQFEQDTQNRKLESLRDALLPKLLSGELSVSSNGEQPAGEALRAEQTVT